MGNPWNEVVAFSQSTPGLAGLITSGTGWTSNNTQPWLLEGTITVRGTRTVAHAAVANAYW